MNPLAIRIAADLKAFKANMDQMKGQLETTQASMKRMSSAFDGSKVIADANAMVKSISSIGGASKLTDSEMRRVNATVTEAIAKYKALGQQAPLDLRLLEQATKKVSDETEKLPDKLDKVNTRGVALGAAIGTFIGGMAWSAVSKLGAEVVDLMKLGGQLPALKSSFNTLAKGINVNANEMLSGMQRASRGLVTEFDLMKSANKAMLLGLPVTAESMATLTKAATTLGRAMGLDARQSVDDLITALGRSSPMILDNLGLTVKVGEANEIYARQLGKTVAQLSDAEKKTAFYNEAMRKAAEKTQELGEQTLTLGDYLGIVWTKFADQVTEEAARANEGIGGLISNWGVLRRIITEGPESGMGAAIAPIIPTGPQAAMIQSLIPVIAKTNDLTEEQTRIYKEQYKELSKAIALQEAAIKEAERFAEAVLKLKDKINGVVKPTKEWAEAVKQLGMSLQTLPKGPGTAMGWFDSLPDLTGEIRKFNQVLPTATSNIKSFFDQITARNDDMQNVLGSDENLQFLPTAAMIDLQTGKLIPAVKKAGDKAALSFKEAFGNALSNIADSIVRALEGGGNVILSVVGTIATSAGNFFSSKFAAAVEAGTMTKGMAALAGGMVTGIIGVTLSVITDMLKPAYTFTEQLAMQFGKTTKVITEQLKAMGAAGKAAFDQMTESSGKFVTIFDRSKGFKDAQDMFGLLDQFQTKEELDKIALQWKGVYDYMLSSGKYTAQALADAWKQYEDAQKKAMGSVDPADNRPMAARGFPTRAQLQVAAAEAAEAYRYIRDSGLYTADVIEQAWQQWQDAMIASGDETAKRMKELQSEIASLQKAVELETPEYDVNGVRMYGVEELRNIERLAALEAEKAALNLIQIENEAHATEEAAKQADLQAKKEFEAAKLRALDLDGYLRKLFTGGYEIPITFKLPNGVPSGPAGSSPSWFGGGSGTAPTMPAKSSATAVTITVPVLLDGREVARNQVKYIPGELDFSVGPLR